MHVCTDDSNNLHDFDNYGAFFLVKFNLLVVFAHGCYVTSMSVEGNRMVLDHSLTRF